MAMLRIRFVRFTVILVVLFSTWAGAARAQSATAEALFRAGREASARGDFEQGCSLFREADRIEPSVGTELNIAVCEERAGRLTRAMQMFRAVAELLPAHDERSRLASARARALEARVAHIVLRAATPLPAGSRILLDGQPLGMVILGVPMPVDPGGHSLQVSSPGRVPLRIEVTVDEGDHQVVLVSPGAVISSPPSKQERSPRITSQGALRPSRRRTEPQPLAGRATLTALAFGTAAAAFVVSAVSGIAVLREKATMQSECSANGACSRAGVDAAGRGESLAVVSTATFIGGLATGALGGWLLYTSSKSASPKGATSAVQVSLTPGGVSARSSF
jgi:hypothetical protein